MGDINKDFLTSLDKRVSDHDTKIANTQRDYTELGHEIKELLNRINNGVSPSVNEVRKENSEIKLAIANMDHKFEIGMIEMKSMVKSVVDKVDTDIYSFDENTIKPIRKDMNRIQGVLFYGLVGALIIFAGQKLLGSLWDKVFSQEPKKIESIAELKSTPMKRG
jgi:hypothetical protein